MTIETLYFDNENWNFENELVSDKNTINLVLVFGDTDVFENPAHYEYLKNLYPNADIVGSSSAGHVLGPEVSQRSIVASAIHFEKGSITLNTLDFKVDDDLEAIARNLVAPFSSENLQSIFIISDGLHMNGSALAKGVNLEKENILISGGLAGDEARFKKTLVMANDIPKEQRVVAIAFYGKAFHVSGGAYGGWEEFGVERIVTKSESNVVYEIDNEPALALYKRYLGDEAKELPASGLRFPLNMKPSKDAKTRVRTLLAIDEATQSITFAGDIPQGSYVKLMKTDINNIIDASEKAAQNIVQNNKNTALALVVSCIGRKTVLGELVDEELEVIEDTLGKNVHLTGFYSYGELAPFSEEASNCELHNQTMTVTVIYED